jgi:hypothetical protein
MNHKNIIKTGLIVSLSLAGIVSGQTGGQYAPKPVKPAISQTQKNYPVVALGDFDKDGEAELVVVDAFNDRVRTFDYMTAHFIEVSRFNEAVYAKSVALGDFDKDGEAELVVVDAFNGRVRTFDYMTAHFIEVSRLPSSFQTD